jgi:hypothetical protein
MRSASAVSLGSSDRGLQECGGERLSKTVKMLRWIICVKMKVQKDCNAPAGDDSIHTTGSATSGPEHVARATHEVTVKSTSTPTMKTLA